MKWELGFAALASLGMAACTSGIEYKVGGNVYSTKDAKVHEILGLPEGLEIKVYEGDRNDDGNVDFIIVEGKEVTSIEGGKETSELGRIIIADSDLDSFANFQYMDFGDKKGNVGADGVIDDVVDVEKQYRIVTGKDDKEALGDDMKMKNILKLALGMGKSMAQ